MTPPNSKIAALGGVAAPLTPVPDRFTTRGKIRARTTPSGADRMHGQQRLAPYATDLPVLFDTVANLGMWVLFARTAGGPNPLVSRLAAEVVAQRLPATRSPGPAPGFGGYWRWLSRVSTRRSRSVSSAVSASVAPCSDGFRVSTSCPPGSTLPRPTSVMSSPFCRRTAWSISLRRRPRRRSAFSTMRRVRAGFGAGPGRGPGGATVRPPAGRGATARAFRRLSGKHQNG